MNIECPDPTRKTPDQLLRQFQDDNLRLVRENLRLRNRIGTLKRAFAKFGQKVRGTYKPERPWAE